MLTGEGVVLNQPLYTFDFLTKGSGVEDFLTGVIVFLIFLRVVAIIWTAKDISARTHSTSLQIASILFVTLLTPLIGLPLYWVIRPVGYKKDGIPWREACASNMIVCYNCQTLNDKSYECCISCGERLKIVCKQCTKEYPHTYQYCHHCGAPNID